MQAALPAWAEHSSGGVGARLLWLGSLPTRTHVTVGGSMVARRQVLIDHLCSSLTTTPLCFAITLRTKCSTVFMAVWG